MKTVIVIGSGEVGKAIASLVSENPSFKLYVKDIEPLNISESVDVMHVCIPFGDKFELIVKDYIKEYSPKLTIINSTVSPGTTKRIFNDTTATIVHSPVRGLHPDLLGGLKKFIKFIGPSSPDAGKLAEEHFQSLGLQTEILQSSVNSELGKLLATTYYALNIAFHQDMERMCETYGADFKEAVTRFNATMTMDIEHKIPRPVMYPGVIGGHCLMPNIEILQKDVDTEFLRAIQNSNELQRKRKEEGKVKYDDLREKRYNDTK